MISHLENVYDLFSEYSHMDDSQHVRRHAYVSLCVKSEKVR